MACKPQLPDCLGVSDFYGALYEICFSPVNLTYVNLIIRPAKELRGEEGKSSPPLPIGT